jgi:sigma-B regulation protein RsbU (phosphoserine phosphatase)
MSIIRRDIIQILRDENDLLKVRNQQVSSKLSHHQQAFRVLNELCDKARSYANLTVEEFDIGSVLNDLLALILHACNIDNGSLILIDEEAEQLEFVAVIGKSHGHLLNHRVSLQGGLVGHVIKSGEALLIEDIHHSNRWSDTIDERLGFHTRSVMCVPLNIEDSIIGAIEVANHASDLVFDEHDLNVLRVATRLVSFALERVEAISISLENKT